MIQILVSLNETGSNILLHISHQSLVCDLPLKYEKTMSEMYLFIDLLSNTCEIWWMICILYRWWSHKIIPSNIETTHLTATLIKYMLYCRNTLGNVEKHIYIDITQALFFMTLFQECNRDHNEWNKKSYLLPSMWLATWTWMSHSL